MQRLLTLALLLISSSTLYAQETLNPEAHKAYVFSSNSQPVLSGNGNCVRFSGYLKTGKPSCYVQPQVTTTTTETAIQSTPNAVKQPEVTKTVQPTEPGIYPVATASAETPKTEPIRQPEPIIADTQVIVQQATTYSYTTSVIDAHIYFDFDKNNLRIDEQVKLERAIIAAREANKLFKVSVDGHTDSRGTDAYNYDLSKRRINTVVNYLNLRGIETNSTMAWGESQLIKFADGSENYDHSRRAVVKFKVQYKTAN